MSDAGQPRLFSPLWRRHTEQRDNETQSGGGKEGPTIRMANLLMHPRADSLTFLFTTQSRCERELRKEERKGKKNRMLFFISIIRLYLAQTVVVPFFFFFSRACWFDL